MRPHCSSNKIFKNFHPRVNLVCWKHSGAEGCTPPPPGHRVSPENQHTNTRQTGSILGYSWKLEDSFRSSSISGVSSLLTNAWHLKAAAADVAHSVVAYEEFCAGRKEPFPVEPDAHTPTKNVRKICETCKSNELRQQCMHDVFIKTSLTAVTWKTLL